MVIGIISVVYGLTFNPARAWGNILICNFYFISLAIGATFFMALQSITQSGWSSMFKRVPEAMGTYLPYAGLLMLLFVIFGAYHVYPWTHADPVKHDSILLHKTPYLNMTFFIVRFVLFFAAWIVLTRLLRKYSIREDREGGVTWFQKSEFISKVYIFTLALTFSLAAFDWIMSIDTHWFSTIFAFKNFVSAFYHGAATITLIVILLNRQGYFSNLNDSHLHDFSKYIFMLSIIWGYMWFAQFFLIWYANLPEETIYYVQRMGKEWKVIFLLDISINWMFPFLFLMLNKIAKNRIALFFTAIIVLIGMWLDLYLQVMPGITGKNNVGFAEIGTYAGFLGLFIFSVGRALSKANIIPVNHPYLEESLLHKVH